MIQPKKRIPFPKRKKQFVKDYSSQKLINTSEEKFEHSPGLKAWADIQNLKIAASSYSETGSIAELKKQLAAKSVLAKTARSSLVETEHQLKDLGQILKYAEQFSPIISIMSGIRNPKIQMLTCEVTKQNFYSMTVQKIC